MIHNFCCCKNKVYLIAFDDLLDIKASFGDVRGLRDGSVTQEQAQLIIKESLSFPQLLSSVYININKPYDDPNMQSEYGIALYGIIPPEKIQFIDVKRKYDMLQRKAYSMLMNWKKKPDKKGEKAPPVDKIRIEDLLSQLQENPPVEADPCSLLFEIFSKLFLFPSAEQGLIDLKQLALSGDGTPVYTAAQQRKKRLCNCLENGIHDCECPRKYSQPDCDIGWDSHRNRYYFGYDLYMLTASDSENDLPIFPLLGPASRHDLHGFAYTFFSMKKLFPDAIISKVLLDSAHDALPLYQFFRQEGITPFIDLNWKAGRPIQYKDTFSIGKDGVPICRAGFKMHPHGSEPKHEYLFYRCPAMYKKSGCTCDNPCTSSPYGRVVKLAARDNPRLINIPPRNSEQWKLEYNARTSSERCNKRQKIDLKLESGSHRSSRMWYCRLYSIMMCQHLNAWALPKTSSLKDLF